MDKTVSEDVVCKYREFFWADPTVTTHPKRPPSRSVRDVEDNSLIGRPIQLQDLKVSCDGEARNCPPNFISLGGCFCIFHRPRIPAFLDNTLTKQLKHDFFLDCFHVSGQITPIAFPEEVEAGLILSCMTVSKIIGLTEYCNPKFKIPGFVGCRAFRAPIIHRA